MTPVGRRPSKRLTRSLLARSAGLTCAAIEALEFRRLLTAWFVSTTGSPSNSGSLNQPFATIQQAANVAQPGDTVYIMGGVYHETVTPPTSGTAGAPIIFEPYAGQTVTIDGADPITGWSSYQGSIYSAPQSWDLGEGNNQVFVDGTMVDEARWPNTPANIAGTGSTSIAPANISTPTWATATSVSVSQSSTGLSTVTIRNASLNQPAGTWVGSIAHIVAGAEWVEQTGTIIASSPGSITVAYQQESTYQVPQAGNRFYIVGNFKALDSAGEWYRDPVSGNLFLWDPAGDNPANHVIEAKARDYGFDLSGLSNIDVNGINLFACTINTDANSSNNILNGISAQYVSQSIGITPDTLDPWGAKFHPHSTGIILIGTGNTLENSTIAFSSGDGVFLGGSGNTVENTVIHDVDYEAGDEAGVTSIGSDETILGDTIYNAGRCGIVCRYTYDSLISHNVIHTVGLQMTDLGAIYTWGTDGDGTEISYNVVYDVHSGGFGAAGIYLDNGSQDFVVDHNLVFNCDFALKLNPPSWGNLIVSNTFVGTQYALQSSGNEDMTGTVLTDNIFSGATMFGAAAMRTNNINSPTNPAFVNATQQNYQLQAGSPAINAGIVDAPYTINFNGAAPDIGGYEYGITPFQAGAMAAAFIPAPPSIPTITPPPMAPVITWATPSSIMSGTPLGASQLNAAALIPGTFVYTPASGTILSAGNGQVLNVTFIPLDPVDYTNATASVTINVIQPAFPVINWTNPSDIVYGTALSTAQLDATSPIAGTFVYASPAGTILGAGLGQNLSVTFTPTDTFDYATANASVTINVTPATPTIAWANPNAIVDGTALSDTQLNATSPIPGSFVYTPAAGTILDDGVGQNLSVTFIPTDTADYTSATASATINVTPATPITWLNASPITYGVSLSTAQLDATSPIPGTFVYSPAAGTILGAATGQTLSVTFAPTNTLDYAGGTASTTIDVAQATPAISWPNPSTITYGTPLSAAQLDATTPVAGTFTYNLPAGTVLSAGNGQALFVTFTPTDATNYTSATQTATINVAMARPKISWPTPSAITYGTALSAMQLDATSPVAGTFAYNLPAGTVLSAGNNQAFSVAFTPTDTIDYTSATASAIINVKQAVLTVRASSLSRTYGAANPSLTYALSGFVNGDASTVVSGKPTLSTTAVAANTAGVYPINVAAGTLAARNYTFSPVNGNLTVNPAATTSTLTSSGSTVFGQSVTFTAAVTSPSGAGLTGTVQFRVNGTNIGSPVTLTSAKATYTTSTLAAGNQSVTAVYNGNTNFVSSTSKAVTQTVAHATTSMTLTTSTATAVFGQSVTFTAKVAAAAPAKGTPTGAITFKDGATVLKTVTLVGGIAVLNTASLSVVSHSITAVYSGDSNFTASTSKSLAQVVKQAATRITLSTSAASIAAGQPLTLTATIVPVAPGVGVPTGTVIFKNGTTVIGTMTISGGKAILTIKTLAKGTYKITASYVGSTNFLAGVSAAIAQVIS